MQLDKTAIAITQRSLDDLLDLGLAVMRRYGMTLLKPALFGILPFALLNVLLLWSITSFGDGSAGIDRTAILQYIWLMLVLVYLEAPLALSGVTIVLGNIMFGLPISRESILETLKKQAIATIWVLGFARMTFPLILFIASIVILQARRAEMDAFASFWITMFFLIVFAVRSFRPFAPEILLLEKCKLSKSKGGEAASGISYSARSSRLHAAGGELFAMTLMVGFVASAFLLASIIFSTFLIGALVGKWGWGWWMDLIFYPLGLWLIALWGTVMRFLIYMNMRIRGEGWELELKLKAEARRIKDARETGRV